MICLVKNAPQHKECAGELYRNLRINELEGEILGNFIDTATSGVFLGNPGPRPCYLVTLATRLVALATRLCHVRSPKMSLT